MPKKNFKDINPAMAFITETQEEQDAINAHDTQHEQNTHVVSVAHTTQGKKGHKLPRINMAFSPENLEYLQIISRIEGMSITEYVNTLIKTDSSKRANEITQAKSILKI
jgi:predicted DNA binding CopG/RHH family protein